MFVANRLLQDLITDRTPLPYLNLKKLKYLETSFPMNLGRITLFV